MFEYEDINDSVQSVISQFEASDKARAYIAVTSEHGPSQQLIDFINFDGGLSQELGLESFSNLSTEMQHALLLANLNLDLSDQLAMESLSGTIDKITNWVSAASLGGFIGAVVAFTLAPSKSKLIIGGISYAALATASLVKAGNVIKNGVYPYAKYKKFEDRLTSALAMDKDLAEHLPTEFTLEAWDRYKEHVGDVWDVQAPGLIHKWNFTYGLTTKGRVTVDVAKWTSEGFKESTKILVEGVEKLHKEEAAYADKLKKIGEWVASATDENDRKVAKLITGILGKNIKMFEETHRLVNWLGEELNIAGKQFKIEEKN